MRLVVARLLMRLPHGVWRRLPWRVKSWAVDRWLWSSESVRHLYASPAAMRRSLGRVAARRAVDALDPGGV